MTDQNTNGEKEAEKPTAETTGERDNKESLSPIDSANQTIKRLEEANKRTEELLKRQEDLLARRILGGQSESNTEVVTKELTPAEYARKVMSNSL